MAKANLFVLPSLAEGFGIAAVEAMLLEVPCLCSNVGGIPEFVFENETGWLFDPNDEIELIEKLNKIIELPESEMNSISRRAKDFISDKFTNKKYVQNLEEFYKTLVK